VRGVTAVVPNWNRKELLVTLLDCLKKQTLPPEQVLVVDNASEDGSAAAAESLGARVIRMESNVGFAAAVNRGIAEAATPWVAILNNDVEFGPTWLAGLLAAAEAGQAWFVTGKLLRIGSSSCLDGSFDLPSRSGCAWRAGSGRTDGPVWDEPRRIASAPLTAALFRKELFLDLGLLDERFGSYLEDVDFGLRCAAAGKTGLYVPQTVARHHGSGTLGEWSPTAVRWIARNQMLLVAKHAVSPISWPTMAGQLLWGLLALRHGRLLSFLKGKVEGLRIARRVREPEAAELWKRMDGILRDSERLIRELQERTGFDLFWRLYFALIRV
jgi:GT2 family glycosyltransferase